MLISPYWAPESPPLSPAACLSSSLLQVDLPIPVPAPDSQQGCLSVLSPTLYPPCPTETQPHALTAPSSHTNAPA